MLYKQVNRSVVPLSEDEVAELEAIETHRKTVLVPIWNRQKRDELLADTDWWASSDVSMTEEQKDYRQALRDITGHVNWPNLDEADWPVKPV
jgi:hypothetical protein